MIFAKITSVYQIIVYKKVQKLVKRFMGTNSRLFYRGISVRIDYPGDKVTKQDPIQIITVNWVSKWNSDECKCGKVNEQKWSCNTL